MVTCMLKVLSIDVYALLDHGATFSFVTLYVAVKFGFKPKKLLKSFSVSTPIRDSILAEQIYRNCTI